MKTSASNQALIAWTEPDVVRCAVIALVDEGYRVRTEVPNMGQSADIVATRNRWVTAIEAKKNHWRRALDQCRAHEQVADFIGVAVGSVGIPAELRSAVEEMGYGLLHCPPGSAIGTWVVRPVRNLRVWVPERERLTRAMRAIDYEC